VKRALAIAFASLLLVAASDDPSEQLKDPAKEARARSLFQEFRCVVCQNENIAGSDADIAHDVRTLVREQIAAGSSDQQVRDYLRARYGDFILLRPRLTPRTALLWGGPFAIVLIGGALIVLRRRRQEAGEVSTTDDLTPAEAKALKQLQENRLTPGS
jgi:cytochrome c-type biogenesis protein CcmH